MYDFRVIVNTFEFDIPFFHIKLPIILATHAGLLINNEVFDYGPDFHRRTLNECGAEFKLDIRGYPEGKTNVSPNRLENEIITNDTWTEDRYNFLFHNCHDFVSFCLLKIGNPVDKYWFIYLPFQEYYPSFIKNNLEDIYIRLTITYHKLFRPGGVEFIFPRIIPTFTDHFCFSNIHYIGFKFHENNYNIHNQLLKLINEKFLINNIQIKDMNQLFSTILNELSIGYLIHKKLPFISLNFNKKSIIYSIQNDYYKTTLTGNIIAFLDFYLKCYVNGGFFKEEFIYEWHKTKNTNKEYLESNIILLHKYLLEFYGDKKNFEYHIFEEFLKEEKYRIGVDYLTAFRIIGQIKNNIDVFKEILIPDCHYEVEADFTPFPKLKNKAIEKQNIENAIEIMRKLTYLNMEKVPYFQPYFELLRIITFCIHYLPNIQESGLFPDLSDSIQNKYPGIKYVRNVPPVFPQLPVRKIISIKVDIHFNDIIELMDNEVIGYINKIISYIYLEKNEKDEEYLIYSAIIDKSLEDIYKKKIKEKLGKENEYLVAYFNLKEKGLNSIKNMFYANVNDLIIKNVKKEYIFLFKIINENKNIFGDIFNNYNVEKLSTLTTLKKIEDFINEFVSLVYLALDYLDEKFEKRNIKFDEQLKKLGKERIEKDINNMYLNQRKLLYEKFKNTIKVNEILNKQVNKDILEAQKLKIKNKVEQKIEEKIDKNKKKEQQFKLTIEGIIENLSKNLIDISNKIKNSTVINKNQKYENKKYIFFNVQFPKISYESKINLDNIKNNTIGGCLPAINNNIILNNIIINDNSYKSIKENKNQNFNFQNKYYIIKSKLKQGFTFDDSILYNTLKTIDKGKENIISSLQKKDYNPKNNIKDYNGATITHYKMYLNDENTHNFITENELKIKDDNDLRPEIYAICANNIKLIEKLFKMKNSDFSSNICDVASPFLVAIMTQNREMINIFLNNYKRLGDLNYSSEDKNTPLHYLCLLNMPEESFRLLQIIDRLDIENERDGNNPLQILCINSNFETLKKIMNYNKIDNYINMKRYDGKTLLHFTSENSLLCTSLLLRKKIDKYSKDINNATPLENAFFSGRYDCFNRINDNDINNSLFIELNTKLNNILTNITRKNTNEKSINIKSKDLYIREIKRLLKNEDINGIIQLIENNNKLQLNILPFNDYKSCKKIVNCACKVGNIKYIELLLKLIDHKKFPIAPFIGKYGLVKWVNDLVQYGINLFQSDKNILEGKTILDFCVESNNSKLYKLIFKNIEKPNHSFKNIISNNLIEALFTKKKYIIVEIINQLEKPKFKNMELSIEKLSYSYKTTSKILNYCLKLKFINPRTLDIYSAVKFCRPSVVRIILSLVSNEIKEENLKKIVKAIIKHNRLDNLLIINEKYNINQLYHNAIDLNIINKKILEIESLAESQKTFAENILIKQMEKINRNWNIGLIELPSSNTYLLHTFFKNNNFWILDCLPEPFKSDIFIEDEKGITPFGYVRIFNDDFINIYLAKLINFFHLKQINDREKAIKILDLLNSINNVITRDKYEDKYIPKLFDIIKNISYIYSFYNKNDENILHIMTKIKKIDINSIKLIVDNFKKLKKKNLKFFQKLINSQNNEGETPIMNIFKSENLYYIDAIITEFKEDIYFYLFNVENNNILHLLFLNMKWDDKTYIENRILYNILINIFSTNTDIILHQNIKFINPCILSSSSGCNISLFLMYCLYNKEIIEKYNFGINALCQACKANNINTVRYLIEYLNYDINCQIKYNPENYELFHILFDDEFIFPELSTPLHISGYYSCLAIVKYLINNGANPFLLDENNNDSISICIENGDEAMLSYLFSTKIININDDNGKYLISLVKNKNANKYFDIVVYKSLKAHINIIDEKLNNLIMISCLYKNPQITRKLLNFDFDLLAKNKFGFNLMHICCYNNSYSCAGIILDFLYNANQMDIIYELFYSKNNDGETPLHIASEKNRYSLTLLLLSYFIKRYKPFKAIKNNRNLTPIQLSIFKHNFEITLIYIKILNINIIDLLSIKIDLIKNEFDSFMYLYDSGYYKNLIDEISNKYNSIQFYEKNGKEKINIKKQYILENECKDNVNKKIKPSFNIGQKSYKIIKERLNKKYINNQLNEDLYWKYKSLFLGQNLILFFEKSNQKEIKKILDIFPLIPYESKLILIV